MENILTGKRGLIFGLANKRSIAWGIAKHLKNAGAELGFATQNERFEKKIEPMIQELGGTLFGVCDLTNFEAILDMRAKVEQKWGTIDFIVHSVAFSNKDELQGRYLDTTRENFTLTLDISCYTFVSILQAFDSILNEGGSALTLSYLGAQKAIPNYNVMGVAKAALEASVRYLAYDFGPRNIRVNAISAGPISTLAAMGISDFDQMLQLGKQLSMLNRNITLDDLGKSAVYLLSDLSSGVTGDVLFVDGGIHNTMVPKKD